MGLFHTCEKKHCRAGWVTTLAGEAGKALERRFDSVVAAMKIYDASSPLPKVSPVRFFESDETALADMKRMAELEAAQQKKATWSKTETTLATKAGNGFIVNLACGGNYSGLFQVWDADGNEISDEEEKRLLALFGASQQLLEACKRLLQHAGIADASAEDIDGADHQAESQARAAISEAEGRA